nr:hypothetical protein [Rhodoferax sp.]
SEGGEGNVLPGADRGGETAGFNPPSHRLRVGEFEVAKSGGIWVAIRELSEWAAPELRENYRFSRKELVKIADELVTHLGSLCHEWRKIHGNF